MQCSVRPNSVGTCAALSVALLALLPLVPARVVAAPLFFYVTSPADVPDHFPGNGRCETALDNGVCTLRGAVQEANAHAGDDIIVLQANVTYVLTRVGTDDTALSGDLDITDHVTIVGVGATSTIIDGNGALTGERVFEIPCLGDVDPVCHDVPPAATVSITGVAIQNGKANLGGGILNHGTLTMTDSVVINSLAIGSPGTGGGIASRGRLTLTNSTVAGNASSSSAGGIYNSGTLSITNSTISGNNALISGGGLYSHGTTTVTTSTISGNTAGAGGGIYQVGTSVVVINSTISGNHSTADGGGIYVAIRPVSLFNVTVTRNRSNADGSGAGQGGGVYVATDGTLTFQNSIIASNENVLDLGGALDIVDDNDCSGALASHGHNIMSAIPFYCTVTPSVMVVNPQLGLLNANGGRTQTHALLTGSPGINAGNAGGCTDDLGALLQTDQRGSPRRLPYGGRCDIGAFEASGFTSDPLVVGSSAILAVHIIELRTRIDAQRTRFGLDAFGWTGTSLAGGLPVMAIHMSELRTAIQGAYIEAGRTPPTFTDSSLVPQVTVIKALHIKELRDAVVFLEAH